MNIFTENSLWLLIIQSDTMSKFVLLILLIMSVICWTLFMGKLLLFYIKEKHYTLVNHTIEKAKTVQDLEAIIQVYSHTEPGYFITKTLVFLKNIGFIPLKSITAHQWELIEKNNDTLIDVTLHHDESYLSFLSSSAAVAPLLGLFGTVWGLVHAFISISETQIADITTMAPGIAEALITTLAGLMVAIPALIMFNYLHTKMRAIEYKLFILSDRMMFILHQYR